MLFKVVLLMFTSDAAQVLAYCNPSVCGRSITHVAGAYRYVEIAALLFYHLHGKDDQRSNSKGQLQ